MLGNSASILINRLTQSITTFILVASIARILGAYELGQYLLAFSYYFVFMTLTSQGFRTLFTREISLNTDETPKYLVSGSLLQLIYSVIGYLILVAVVFILPYSSDTSIVCYIMGLTIIPFSLSNITEAIFQAREKMFLVATSTVPVYIARLLIMILAMNFKYGVIHLASIYVVSEIVILIAEWGLISRLVKYKFHINWNFIWSTVKQSRTFLFIEGVSVLQSRIQILILSLFGGEIVVGLYSAISQLMQPFEIVSHSLVSAYFPKMAKAVTDGKDEQRHISGNLVEMLLIVALPFIIGILFNGSDLLILVYQNESFRKATYALSIIAIGLFTTAFTRPLSYTLVANKLEIVNLWEVFITTVLASIIGIILVPQYQLAGAAYSVLAMQIVRCIIYTYTVHYRLFNLNLFQILLRPILLSCVMLGLFIILEKINANIYITLLTSTGFYLLIICSFSVYTLGGLNAIKAKLLQNKSNI
jgi:O-antigen/teichoic acid export membrane protein